MPPGGFSTSYLADESGLGQAMAYIRPIQKDLNSENIHCVSNLHALTYHPLITEIEFDIQITPNDFEDPNS